MTKDFEVTRFEIAKLELRPGDRVILKTDLLLTKDQVQNLRDSWRQLVPDNEIIVLTAGLTIEVLRPEPSS
jgi:G3E family GTPase